MSKDVVYLRHMCDIINEIEEYAALDRSSGVVKRSVERCLEILGEAANNLSDDLQQRHPEISWAGIIGMRNRIIHQYFRVDYEILWEVVEDEVPHLKTKLSLLLRETEPKD